MLRIGIVSILDIGVFASYFDNRWQELIERNRIRNAAPAVFTLCQSFLKEGHFLRIFTLGNENVVISAQRVEVVLISTYTKYPFRYFCGILIDVKHIRRAVNNRYKDLDVLHAHWTYEYAFALKSLTTQLPIFCTVRDWAPAIWRYVTMKEKIIWFFKRIVANRVLKTRGLHFIANSSYTATLLKNVYEIDAPVIPNSVNDSFLTMAKHTVPDRLKILCISSSDDQRKNVVALVRAFGLICQKYPDAELHIIGDAFYQGSPAENLWRKLGIWFDGIKMMGGINHDQLIAYLDGVTMYVTPSREETFGNTIIEAFSRGVPVIGGKNSGAVPFLLQGGRAGYLCDVEDMKDIAHMIEYVYTHREEAVVKTIFAKQILKEKYSEVHVARSHLEYYRQVVKQIRNEKIGFTLKL